MIINGKEIKINRENAVISEADRLYCEALEYILENGQLTHNRTGIDTLSVAGLNFKFDLQKGFPILETKKVFVKNAASEIQWIHQVQSNDVNWLHERENHTWDGWMIDDDGIYRIYEQGENAVYDPEREVPLMQQFRNPTTGVLEKLPVYDKYNNHIMVKSKDIIDNKSNPRTIKEAIWFGRDLTNTIGWAYGYINSKTLMPQSVDYTLKRDPYNRRMAIDMNQVIYLDRAVLPSCVWSVEYKVSSDGKLNMYVHQRSADMPIGVPFNFAQYALQGCMFAKSSGLEPGTMSWSMMDAHIYVNQIDKVKQQLNRYHYMQEYSDVIINSSDEDIEILYNKINSLYNKLYNRAKLMIIEDIDTLKTSQIIAKLKTFDNKLASNFEEIYERKICFEHMLLRETPTLELASHNSFFEYSTEYVKKNDPYLNENPIGNKELVLKKYHSTPFISTPIAQ